MREMALFAGAGGGLLASHLLGWTPIVAVERDAYCKGVLEARQADGSLPVFPIHPDIVTFSGYAYAGRVDVVSGGFPCQPFSTASHGRRIAVDLWPEMLRVVGETRSEWVFAENVAKAPIEKAADDLESLGYVVRCCPLSSADLGAPTRRTRYWLVGRSHLRSQSGRTFHAQTPQLPRLAGPVSWPNPPGKLGMVNGVAHRVDRLKALGNGQCPRVAAAAFILLAGAL